MTALCCLCRTCLEFQAKKCSSLEENNTKDKHTEILPKQKGVKKLCPFSLEKRSLGGGKWVVRKEQSFTCCNGKGGQLVSVQSEQGKKQQAPTAAGKMEV